MKTLKTEFHTVAEIIASELSTPLPLEVIPNHMGINLCSVEALSWTEQADGQLVSLTIHFLPESQFDSTATHLVAETRCPDCGVYLRATAEHTCRYRP